jgi:signal transduction histidine kinase
VRIELADVGLQVETVVIDQGGGFTHPLQALVPFTTTDRYRNRDSGGCGLGLAIAKGIIEAHGARLQSTRVPEVGSGSFYPLVEVCVWPNASHLPCDPGSYSVLRGARSAGSVSSVG